ncbi:hypothetical protein M9Y10_014100 [Tritrichomonas musculus]|uniref:Uncharacterized protein n=1 Tax=Tritrichomonas musculus TaxID=1915356 RepID=A0ABR2KYN4_9EUKA
MSSKERTRLISDVVSKGQEILDIIKKVTNDEKELEKTKKELSEFEHKIVTSQDLITSQDREKISEMTKKIQDLERSIHENKWSANIKGSSFGRTVCELDCCVDHHDCHMTIYSDT